MRSDGIQANQIIQSMFLAQYGNLGDHTVLPSPLSPSLFFALPSFLLLAPVSTLLLLLRLQCFQEAEFWFKEMKKDNFKVSRVDYLTLIKWHVMRGEREGVKKWLREAKRDQFLDVRLLSSIIVNSGKSGNFADAWFWLEEMRREGVRPNIITFNGMIGELARRGEMLEADKWAKEAQKEGLTYDQFTCSSMAYGYAKVKKAHLVDYWMGILEKTGNLPNAVAYSSVIAGFATNRDMESAKKWHDKMKKRGLKLTGMALNLMAQGYAEKGEVEKCSEIVQEMIAEGVYVDDVLTSLLAMTTKK